MAVGTHKWSPSGYSAYPVIQAKDLHPMTVSEGVLSARDLRTTTGSVYSILRDFCSRNALLNGESTKIHHMSTHSNKDNILKDSVKYRSHWNRKSNMSFVGTKTFISLRDNGSNKSLRDTDKLDTFILLNYREYGLVYQYEEMQVCQH